MKPSNISIAFDINGTLVSTPERHNFIRQLLRLLKLSGFGIWVVSGREVSEMKVIIKDIGLENFVDEYRCKTKLVGEDRPDWIVDDGENAYVLAKSGGLIVKTIKD